VEFLEQYTGDWALRLLLTTLAMTPLRKLTRMSEPIRVRRLLGLWSYAFLCPLRIRTAGVLSRTDAVPRAD
jgi:methionine sulfoxide reductase heme-binding subunit